MLSWYPMHSVLLHGVNPFCDLSVDGDKTEYGHLSIYGVTTEIYYGEVPGLEISTFQYVQVILIYSICLLIYFHIKIFVGVH